ncbi:MAG: VOC family protein [Alphaproteobacteria bacterium]|nr:VOC family protein [Alphaproteobacteria bacterium]
MAMELNHTIINAADQQKSAQFYCDIFGLEYQSVFDGHFLAVKINDRLAFDFEKTSAAKISSQHYAFKVSEQEFDEIFDRIKARNLPYNSSPDYAGFDMKVNHHNGGRGVYFRDLDGHVLEILTTDYDDSKPFEYPIIPATAPVSIPAKTRTIIQAVTVTPFSCDILSLMQSPVYDLARRALVCRPVIVSTGSPQQVLQNYLNG